MTDRNRDGDDRSADGVDRHEAVRYECGHRCYDAGIGGAPDLCPRCGLPVSERGYDV